MMNGKYELKTYLSQLADRTVVAVEGPECSSLLQRLLTNGPDPHTAQNAIFSALLTPQGKIISDMFVLNIAPEVIWLDVPETAAKELAGKLSLYRLRARVSIEMTDIKVFALFPDEGQIEQSSMDEPGSGAHLFRDPRHPKAGWRIYQNSSGGDTLVQSLAIQEKSGKQYFIHLAGLGLPTLGLDFALNTHFPHELNMDLVGGIDFGKGCYIGQEIVSRVHHKTRPKVRTLIAKVSGLWDGGEAITGADKPEFLVGHLSANSLTGADGTVGLAMVRLDRWQAVKEQHQTLQTPTGAKVKLGWPDYALASHRQ